MKQSFIATFLLLISVFSNAQVSRKTIVEHFTNSNCSICASQNPGIYNTLSAYSNSLHITFHPSAPYASCVFSMANTIENDARTNFYSIYGSTPRLVVNGDLTPVSGLNSALANAVSALSNFDIQVDQYLIAPDSARVAVKVKKVALDTSSMAYLFVGVKQDTVFQVTGNGENIHLDVFRKGLTTITGDAINLPQNQNDSIVMFFTYPIDPSWITGRLQIVAFLQDSDKNILQASESNFLALTPSNVIDLGSNDLTVFPNPVSDYLEVHSSTPIAAYEIHSMYGQLLKSAALVENKIQISSFPAGTYLLVLIDEQKRKIVKFQIQN